MEELKLSMDFVDNYILKAKSEYALVYLYAYRHKTSEHCPDIYEISSALCMEESLVREAVDYWIGLGFDIFTAKKFPPVADKSRYSAIEIAKFSANDKELAILYEETEKLLKKPLSSNDQQTLFWIYNDLGMSASVIIMMINYTKSIGKCKMRYIEKVAMEWSEKGIVDFADAEEHLTKIERVASYEGRIKKLFGIERNFTSSEKDIISSWCNEIKPTKENLIKAYEICIERTGKFSARYINAILVNWKDEKRGQKPKKDYIVPTPKSTKFNNFTQESGIDYEKFEMDTLIRRLSKRRGDKNAQ